MATFELSGNVCQDIFFSPPEDLFFTAADRFSVLVSPDSPGPDVCNSTPVQIFSSTRAKTLHLADTDVISDIFWIRVAIERLRQQWIFIINLFWSHPSYS